MSNQDIIFVEELTLETIIGIYPFEKVMKQKVVFDIEIYTSVIKSAQTDAISHTVDYKLLTDKITDFVINSKFNLIETLATKVIELILQEEYVSKVKLKVKKPKAIKSAQNVGVTLERSK